MKKRKPKKSRWLKPPSTKTTCMLMSISLRGYSLLNCVTIQIAMFGTSTAWQFTVIFELAALFVIFLIASKKTGVIMVIFATAFYAGLSYGLVMINDASLNLKMRLQQIEIRERLYQDFENLKSARLSQISNLINKRDSEIDKNDNRLDNKRISKSLREYLLNRNATHEVKKAPLSAQFAEIQALSPDNVSDIRKYIKLWLPIVENSRDLIKSDMLSIYNQSPVNSALQETWGMPEDEAKKTQALAMAILVEILIFGFAVIPKIISRKKNGKSKSQKKSQKEQDKIEIQSEMPEPVEVIESQNLKSQKESQKKIRVNIDSVEDLRRDMIRRKKETGEYPAGNCWHKMWRDDYKIIRAELWPEKYGGKK
jgi:hypothetical protein